MSLDVYLTLPGGGGMTESGIFVREGGETKEISRAEWDEKFPGREPVVMTSTDDNEVYWANITHNLGTMASHAGLYEVLWHPDEQGWTKAAQLVAPLRAGIAKMHSDPAYYQQFNPSNGWGDYAGLLRFAEKYLAACEAYPEAEVRVSR